MDAQKQSKIRHLTKTACHKMSSILNWNSETTVKGMGKLCNGLQLCTALYFGLAISPGMSTTKRYGCDSDDYLPEGDRRFLAIFCTFSAVVSLMQTLVVRNEVFVIITRLTRPPACTVCESQKPQAPPAIDPLLLRKFRILNIVCLVITSCLLAANANVLCGTDVWNTDFGALIAANVILQVVSIALFIRGAFSGVTGPARAAGVGEPHLTSVVVENQPELSCEEFLAAKDPLIPSP